MTDMFALAAAAVLGLSDNTLSPKEKADGWQLLFDGQTTKGWRNFKSTTIGAGWVVRDGSLTISDVDKAGDIVSEGKFEWFELMIDFKYEKGQNSGIMFHVADDGEAVWHSGPEIQIMDDTTDPKQQRTGYLYDLISTDKRASKPAGQWNTFRIRVAKDKCFTEVNGVRYYEYVLGSDEFKSLVAKSKFKGMPNFAKMGKGAIAIQGDHGFVSFKNIKIKSL